MSIKFYTDTHIAKVVALQMRQRGIDIVRCEEVGMALVGDFEHIAYSAEQGRSIITNDQGFGGHHTQWLAQELHHAGIFLITKNKDDIGMIVNSLIFWAEAVESGAALLEQDVFDRIIYVP